MTERVRKLREQSLAAVNRISAERAQLITEFYQQKAIEHLPISLQRARSFQYILANKKICINDGELIVGERGPDIKSTPTYPEICLHSIADLEILDSREKVYFKVDNETRRIYQNKIIPFWKGRTQRDRLMNVVSEDWLNAYNAGVFTEFQEQRGPGHTVLGDKIYRMGMLDIIREIESNLTNINLSSHQKNELVAMRICAEALIEFANRHADVIDEIITGTTDTDRIKELKKMSAICRKVPAEKPETLHEALQYYWFVHLGVITELNPWDSFNPGRLDQHLYPFYQKGLENGSLSKEKVKELLQCFWIKFNNHPAPPKIGVTAQESNTYTDFSLINMGGLTVDGDDAVNEMSFILMDVIEEMRLLQPSSMIQVSRKNTDDLLQRALKIIKTGFGQPSIFNSDAIVEELVRQGKSVEDARKGGSSGCVEAGAFGVESYILTGYFNLTKILELTLNKGFDPRTGKQLGPSTARLVDLIDFEQLMEAFKIQLNHFTDIKIRGNDRIEKLYADYLPVPFLSLLIDDCVANAKDYNARGARYNTSYIQGVGLGSLTDILTSIKYNVYDQKKLTLTELKNILDSNFIGNEEWQYKFIYKTPKYGNDDDYADLQTQRIFDLFFEAIDGKSTPLGGKYRINLLPTTCHVYFGSVIGATADGRLAGEPLSEGISPVQGADINGPTAVIKSAAKIDHTKTGGTLLNQKFAPEFFSNDENIDKLCKLIRSYFKLMGHHIQFNVVNAETLKDAQKNPEKFRDLIVRVAGYSDYFNDLGLDLQNEIIRRTEHN